MKRICLKSLLFLSFVFLLSSCKKDSSSNDTDNTPVGTNSYVKIKKNGTWVTYPALGELGPDLYDSSKTDFGVTAHSADSKEIFDLTIQINGNNFVTGVYSSDDYPTYYVDVAMLITQGSSIEHYSIDNVDGREDSKYVIHVTSITPTQLMGNFTGNYISPLLTPGVIEITEGEFKVNRVR